MVKNIEDLSQEQLKKLADDIKKKEELEAAKGNIHLPYSHEQDMILIFANKQLEILKLALANCVVAEKECFSQYIKNNPGEELGNALWRIQDVLKPILEEIDRCEPIDGKRASTMPEYKYVEKPRPVTDKLEQVKEFI